MSNRNPHLLVGCLSGVGLYLLSNQKNTEEKSFGELACVGGASAIGGIMPDLLEPATNPNHRTFFHSVAFGILLGYGVKKGHDLIKNKEWGKLVLLIITAFSVGYFSHLLLDGMTPKGLPILK